MISSPLPPLLISDQALSFGRGTPELGRTPDVAIRRDHSVGLNFHAEVAYPLHPLHSAFLQVLSELAPADRKFGTTFTRTMTNGPTVANESHRDTDNRAMNFVCLVSGDGDISRQHEFFQDDDPWETMPAIIPNGHLIGFTKHLHRRPQRGAGPGYKTFLSASLYRYESDVPPLPTSLEPYVCHGDPVQPR